MRGVDTPAGRGVGAGGGQVTARDLGTVRLSRVQEQQADEAKEAELASCVVRHATRDHSHFWRRVDARRDAQ